LRPYGTEPQIWDAQGDCKHEWIEEKRRNYSGGTSTNLGLQRPGIHKFSTTVGFCRECGAWRGELGLKPTFGLYIMHLCDIFDEVKRVLKKTGTVWVNLGDTYWSAKGSCHNPGGGANSIETTKKDYGVYPLNRGNKSDIPYLKPKSLCLIPSRFAIEKCNRGWVLRNIIVWHKPNCLSSNAREHFTVDFEQLFFFTKNSKYYFESQFEAYERPANRWGGQMLKKETAKRSGP
jgi:hypothetical protein